MFLYDDICIFTYILNFKKIVTRICRRKLMFSKYVFKPQLKKMSSPFYLGNFVDNKHFGQLPSET